MIIFDTKSRNYKEFFLKKELTIKTVMMKNRLKKDNLWQNEMREIERNLDH